MSPANRDPDLIISVESRKGGVGKTTAALSLGRLLLHRGYQILFLDLDITGTNAADVASSPFWSESVHVIGSSSSGNGAGPPANLLKMYDHSFLVGRAIPSFSCRSREGQAYLVVDREKINVFGSQIYGSGENGRGLTVRPCVLFDEVHTAWLLEFVAQLVENFVTSATGQGPRRHAVIIDNSPGFVGVAPAIQQWLTDLGPRRAKFLTVGSLDGQDVQACARGLAALHGIFTGKWDASRRYIEGSVAGAGVEVRDDEAGFYMRLAEVSSSLSLYREESEADTPEGERFGQYFRDHPERYIAFILNRVPRAVKSGRLRYDEEIFNSLPHASALLGRLLGLRRDEGAARRLMVPYDEYIENQFLIEFLRRGPSPGQRRARELLSSFERAEERLVAGEAVRLQSPGFWSEESGRGFRGVQIQLVRASQLLSRARSTLEEAGLGHLARLFHDEWLPGSIVPDFRSALLDLLRGSDLPFFEVVPFERDTGPVAPDDVEFIDQLRERVLMEFMEHPVRDSGPRDEEIVREFAGVLSCLVGLSLTSPMWHSPFSRDVTGLCAAILAIEIEHWRKRDRRHRMSTQRFLASESMARDEAEEVLSRHLLRRRGIIRGAEDVFPGFYRVCTSSQARLIDVIADSRFLLRLMQFVVQREEKKGTLFPFVRGIVEETIVEKSIDHERAGSRMAQAIQTEEYFRDFDEALTRVLRMWEVAE